MTSDGHNGVPVATYHEQTVEIALGPKGAFDDGNVGALVRRVTANRVVNAMPRFRGEPKPPRTPKTPRVIELLRQAIEWQALLESGEVRDQAAIASQEGITRARVTQVMGLLRLSPEIQQHILSMPETPNRPTVTERALRPIAQVPVPTDQSHAFRQLLRC